MGSKVCFIAATNGYPFKKTVGGEGKDDKSSLEVDQPHWHLKIHFIKAKRTIEELRLNGTLSFFARVVAGGRGGRLNKELRLIGCETIRGALRKNNCLSWDFVPTRQNPVKNSDFVPTNRE